MATSFGHMVAEAKSVVGAVPPAEAKRRLEQNSKILILDVRDAADISTTGKIPGALNVSYAALPYKADLEVPEEWREPQLNDRGRPIITTCALGPMAALGAKLLKDLGFTDVCYLEGGTQGWKDAGLPVEEAK